MSKFILLIVTVLFCISCKKNDNFQVNLNQARWNVINLNYTGDLDDIYPLPDDTIMLLSRLDDSYQKTCIFESDDAGKTWNQLCFDKLEIGGFSSFYCFSHLKIFAGNYRSYDGGNNWQTVGDFKAEPQYFFNDSTGIGVWGFTISKTTDGGNSYKTVYDSTSYVGCNFIQFLDNQTGYASGGVSFDSFNSGLIVKTIDGGNTWRPLPGTFKSIIAMSFITPDIGYIIINLHEGDVYTTYKTGAELLKTVDGGNTWISINNKIFNQTGIIPHECYFYDKLHGYICGNSNGGKILSTNNGGITWNEEYYNPSSDFAINKMIFTSFETGYAVGNNGLLLKRTLY